MKKRNSYLAVLMAAVLFSGCGAENYEESSATESIAEDAYEVDTFDTETAEE